MKAASLCQGDLIAFCDQDDVWAPDKISTVAPYFRDPDVMLVAHKANLIDAHDKLKGMFDPTHGLHQQDLFLAGPWPLIYGFAITFRATLLEYSDLWDKSVSHFSKSDRMGHDRWMTFLAANLGKVVILEDQLVSYRQHDANLFGAPGEKIVALLSGSGRSARSEGERISLIAEALDNRVAILDAMSARGAKISPINQQRFRQFARAAKLREVCHSSHPRKTKIWAVFRLIVTLSYAQGNPWRFPLGAMLTDLRAVLR